MYLTILLFGMLSQAAPSELLSSIENYWHNLETGNKVEAMQYVHREDLNIFLHRHEALFRDWEISRVTPTGEGEEYQVVVEFTRQIGGRFFSDRVRDVWVRTDQGWRIRIPRPKLPHDEARARIREASKPTWPKKVVFRPAELYFYPGRPHQTKSLVLRNGRSVTVRVVKFDYDRKRLELIREVEEVAPLDSGVFELRFIGTERTENLSGELRVSYRLGEEGDVVTTTIPVIYNYTPPAIRWLQKQQKSNDPQP